ncbi:hypothetical protein B7R22_14955 [Subtercola boreus]|uniref:DUF4188 domain-containing protein n=1 Tax=Subtercola boreus TaxID=120213 RepID=A0A3E0VS62_9MICO|nr:hypothetical protein [Subtercola boreus]RFA12429.1 hypothetical protein B7R22_14955 [Subtercola boreus]
MRTTDFSRAPKQGRAQAMVVVETALRPHAPHGAARASKAIAASPAEIAAELRRAPGHIWSKRFTRRGISAGVVACFATPGDAVAATDALRRAVLGAATSMTVLVADPNGYSNGVWRAEGNVMAHIPTFTPTSVEAGRGTPGPPVARPTAPIAATSAGDRHTENGRYPRSKPTIFGISMGKRRGEATVRAGGRPAGAAEQAQAAGTAEAARPVTDARAMFIGATKYRGPRALVQLSRTWYPMVARMQTLRGYVWHTVYWEPPFTLGTLAFFATRDDLLSFARLPAHRTLMQWITRGTRNGTGGYIRLHLAPDEAPADSAAHPTTPGPPAPPTPTTPQPPAPRPPTNPQPPAPPTQTNPQPPAPRADGDAR